MRCPGRTVKKLSVLTNVNARRNYMWSHGCQMCEFSGRCAVQTLCIAKDEYDEYRKKMRRSKKKGEATC